MRSMIAILVGCLSLVPVVSASAGGVYIGSEAGLTYVPPITFKAGPDGWSRDPSLGYAVAVQAGYAMKLLRAEAELGFSQPGGDLSLTDAMVNVYYDLPLKGWLTPYFGVGGGVARVAEQAAGASQAVSDTTAAVQAIAGAAYDLTKQLSLKADYRYFRTTEEAFNLTPAAAIGLPAMGGGGARQAKVTPEAHSLMLGVTFRFGGKWRKP